MMKTIWTFLVAFWWDIRFTSADLLVFTFLFILKDEKFFGFLWFLLLWGLWVIFSLWIENLRNNKEKTNAP